MSFSTAELELGIKPKPCYIDQQPCCNEVWYNKSSVYQSNNSTFLCTLPEQIEEDCIPTSKLTFSQSLINGTDAI